MKKTPLRLTGGIYNNRIIYSYNPNTKTTASIVRAAVFNMIDVNKSIVLDLFSGSGAYGFESLSRGANFVYLNDKNDLSIKAILDNAAILKCENKIKITKFDCLKALQYYIENNLMFNYIFIDPPYDFSDEIIHDLLEKIILLIENNGLVIVERNKESKVFKNERLLLIKHKIYGTRQIQIYLKQ